MLLAGCGASGETGQKHFSMAAGETVLTLDAPAKTALENLGAPYGYTETASCAFAGTEKTYDFGSFYLRTYPARDGERKFFEARTRKILLLSNSLASAGNLAFCTVTENLGKLDLGGLIVTAGRLFSDVRFITRLKEEFIEKEIDKSIREELASIDANFIRPEQ